MIHFTKVSCRSLVLAVLSTTVALPALGGMAFADVPTVQEAAPQQGVIAADGAARRGTPVNVTGEISRYVIGPLGHVRGFLLKDGTAVMVRGTSGDAMAKDVPVGQSVRVEGWSPVSSSGKLVMRAAVYGQHGQIVAPPAAQDRDAERSARKEQFAELRGEIAKLPSASANGTVQAVIPGHRGKVIAVVLTDGTSVFLRPSLAKQVATRGIRVGDRIESSGKGATYALGASVLVNSITFGDGAHFEARARDASVSPRT